jgi:hypothetical protein
MKAKKESRYVGGEAIHMHLRGDIWFMSIDIDACASFEYTSRGYTSQCREKVLLLFLKLENSY